MPAKAPDHPLPKYVTPVRRNDKISGYKYLRRVPKALQEDLGRTVWDYYLGADQLAAFLRGHEKREEHDAIIERLTQPTERKQVIERGMNKIAAANVKKAIDKGKAKSPDWRDTANHLQLASQSGPDHEREALAAFAATAFGDRSYIDAADPSPFFAALASVPPATPPADGIEKTMFDAMKVAVDTRLAELEAKRPALAVERITARMEQYIKSKNKISTATARAYRGRIKRFVSFAGDVSLAQIDPPLLRGYRDHLRTGDDNHAPLEAVREYFHPIKSLFNWALKEDLVESNPVARVDLPTASKSVEEMRYVAFDSEDMPRIWEAVSAQWGPGSKSKLSPERRAAFLMVFRVLLWTGMRPNEVFKVRPDQVTADRIKITKTKTSAARIIPLAAPIEDFHEFIHSRTWADALADRANLEKPMSEGFSKIIRGIGITDDRKVLYSTKDTMIARLDALDASENVQRSIIGHTTGRGALRNYKTSAGVEQMREYLDRVAYCKGLGNA